MTQAIPRLILIGIGGVLVLAGVVFMVRFLGRFDDRAEPQGHPPLRVAYQNRIGSAACIIAFRKGLFQNEGLSVEGQSFNSGPACSEALFVGSADIGTMGDTTALIALSRSRDLAILGSHGRGEHRHRLVLQANSPIRTPEELAGCRLAVKKGTSTFGALLAFLQARDIQPNAITIIDMRPAEMPDALASGTIDAFVASEPTPSLAETRGARELATMGDLGNEYPILILAKGKILSRRPDDVRKFLRALRKASVFIRQNPGETTTILAETVGLPPEIVRTALQRHTIEITLDQTIVQSLSKTAEFLVSQGILQQAPDINRRIQPSFADTPDETP